MEFVGNHCSKGESHPKKNALWIGKRNFVPVALICPKGKIGGPAEQKGGIAS